MLPAFRAAILAAVSSPSQATADKTSIAMQVEACEQACNLHGWQVVETIRIEGHSRDYVWLHELLRDSPEFARLISLVESHAVNLIVCKMFDRLWRTSVLQSQVSALCLQHHTQIYSVMQPSEPMPPDRLPKRPGFSGIIQTLSGLVTDEEQNLRTARFRTGMAGRVARGLHGTSSGIPFGYRPTGSKTPLEPDPTRAQWARWIFEKRAEGLGYTAIANTLTDLGVHTVRGGRWDEETVLQILRNPYYVGEVHWGEYRNAHGAHTALIDTDLWQRVQAINQERAYRPYKTNRLFTGLCRCAFCSGSMIYKWDRGERLRLVCCAYSRSGGRNCQHNGIFIPRLRDYVNQAIAEVLHDADAFLAKRETDTQATALHSQVAALDTEIDRAQKAWARWNALYEQDSITADELLGHRQRLTAQLTTLKAQRQGLAQTVAHSDLLRQSVLDLVPLADQIVALDDERLAPIYRRLIQHIVIRKAESPQIVWW